jgi:hypothetical protein
MTPADNAAMAAIVRYNLKNHGLDIPGTAYFDDCLDDLCAFYNGRESCGYYVLTDGDGKVVGGIGFDLTDIIPHAAELQKMYLDDSVTVELIGDGCHIPRHEMLLAIKIKGVDGVSVITDAMRIAATDMKFGKLGSLERGTDVIVEDGVAKLTDRVSFAGSIATMDRCLRTLVQKYNIPLHTASRLLSLSPAKRMGIDNKKGSLELGKDADLVIVDENLQVKCVIVDGEVVI